MLYGAEAGKYCREQYLTASAGPPMASESQGCGEHFNRHVVSLEGFYIHSDAPNQDSTEQKLLCGQIDEF